MGNQVCLSRTPNKSEWGELYAIAKKQGLLGVTFAGVQKFQLQRQEPPEMTYLTWMGTAAKIQQKWERHEAFIGRLAGFYEKHGINMMLLKGYGLSQYYPEAKLRTPGDVDVYLFGDWKKADDAICEELGVTVYNDSEHHTKFTIDDITVENLYDL